MKLVRIAAPGYGAPYPLDRLEEDIAVGAALHALEDARAGVLQRDVDVIANGVVRGDGIEQFPA